MALIERTAYPRFGGKPSKRELAELYSPTPGELDLARSMTRGRSSSLGFLVMLKGFQRLGYFPRPEEVPEEIVDRIRCGLRLDSGASAVPPPRSRARYREAIRRHLGVRAYGDGARRAAAEAVAVAALAMDDPADLVNVAVEELVKERFELPAFSALDRLVRHVRFAVNARLFGRVDGLLAPNGRQELDALLDADRKGRSELNALKASPKSPTAKNLGKLQERLIWLESFGDTGRLLEGIANQKVAHLAAQARALDAAELKGVGAKKRRAMLVCLIHRAKVGARDGLAEMLVKILGRIHNRGREELERVHRERRTSTEAMMELLGEILAGAAEPEADDAALGGRVRETLERAGGPEALLERCRTLSEHRGGNYLPLMWKFYKGRRATLFRVIRSLVLGPTTEDRSLVDALRFVLDNEHRRGEFVPGDLDLSFAGERWRDLVQTDLNGESVLARRHLEVCVFSHVAGELKTGDLCVEGSDKYADYRGQLLSWEECGPLVEEHCRELGLDPTPEGFVGQLRDLLSETAREVDRSYPDNASVIIAEDGEPVLKKVPTKKPSRSVKALEAAIAERMPERNLTDVVCAGEHWTGWTRHLGPLSGSEPKLEHARERYVIVAFGYGTNMGPVQTARHTRGVVTAHELGYVNRRHVSARKLEAAVTDVVNAYSGLALPKVWGTGETAAADGTKIDLYENNLTSEYHIRYGGYGGIAYHHVSDTYVALFTHFIACGVWEAVYIIDGLLKNASEIQPKAVASDTQGQSAPVFGLAHLLGIRLMPRIRNWKGMILFRPDGDASYEHTHTRSSATRSTGS